FSSGSWVFLPRKLEVRPVEKYLRPRGSTPRDVRGHLRLERLGPSGQVVQTTLPDPPPTNRNAGRPRCSAHRVSDLVVQRPVPGDPPADVRREIHRMPREVPRVERL